MSLPEITAYGVPTGGAVTLAITGAVSGSALLERAVSGQTFSTIYSGAALKFYIDIGEALPGPLDPLSFYQYRYTDSGGQTLSAYVQPASIVSVQPEPITQILVRLIQGALNSMSLPTGVGRAEVTHAMPLGGTLKLPLVVVNLDLWQQGPVPVGQSFTVNAAILAAASGVSASGYAIIGMSKRLYRVSILALSPIERDFYRDNLVGVFEALYESVLQPLGIDVTHRWQVSSGQQANDRQGYGPGFYFADVMMEFEGTLNIMVNLSNQIIQTITTTVSGAQQAPSSTPSVDTITVPLA